MLYQLTVCLQITETYAFLPREAVTRFLLGCTECQRRPRSPSPASLLPTPSPSPTLPPAAAPRAPPLTAPPLAAPPALPPPDYHDTAVHPPITAHHRTYHRGEQPPPEKASDYPIQGSKVDSTAFVRVHTAKTPSDTLVENQQRSLDLSHKYSDISQSQTKIDGPLRTSTPEPKRSSNPLDVCNLTSRDPPKISTPPKKRHLNHLSENKTPSNNPTPKIWSPIEGANDNQSKPKYGLVDGEIDYSLPITTTYLKYMRSLGCTDEDALKFEKVSPSYIIYPQLLQLSYNVNISYESRRS